MGLLGVLPPFWRTVCSYEGLNVLIRLNLLSDTALPHHRCTDTCTKFHNYAMCSPQSRSRQHSLAFSATKTTRHSSYFVTIPTSLSDTTVQFDLASPGRARRFSFTQPRREGRHGRRGRSPFILRKRSEIRVNELVALGQLSSMNRYAP